MRNRSIAPRPYRISTANLSFIALALMVFIAPCHSQPGGGSPKNCSKADGAFGVTISSCTVTLNPSPAGTPYYYVDVAISYTGSTSDQAVRIRCDFSSAGTVKTQFGVSRISGSSMRFVSPFNPPTPSIDVACAIDATTAHPS
jgi:hypothetical protein